MHQLIYRSVPLDSHATKGEKYTARLSRTFKFETILSRPTTSKESQKERYAEMQQSEFLDSIPNPDDLMHEKYDLDGNYILGYFIDCVCLTTAFFTSEQVPQHGEDRGMLEDVNTDVLCLKSDHFEYELLLLDR